MYRKSLKSLPTQKKSSSTKQKVSFGRSATPSASISLPPYNPIEVINYFVEVEHKNEMARRRVVTPPPPPPPEPEEELPHNTTVALPKIKRSIFTLANFIKVI